MRKVQQDQHCCGKVQQYNKKILLEVSSFFPATLRKYFFSTDFLNCFLFQVFGFLSWIFFILDFFLCLRNCGSLSLVNRRKKRSVTVQPIESTAGKMFPVEATIMELPVNEREQSLGTHSEQGTPVFIADLSI